MGNLEKGFVDNRGHPNVIAHRDIEIYRWGPLPRLSRLWLALGSLDCPKLSHNRSKVCARACAEPNGWKNYFKHKALLLDCLWCLVCYVPDFADHLFDIDTRGLSDSWSPRSIQGGVIKTIRLHR